MTILNHRTTPVDLDELQDRLKGEVSAYAPPAQRPAAAQSAYTPLQLIAHAMTKLTWREAEVMGLAIRAKMSESIGQGAEPALTAAMIQWAEGWESFDANTL